MSDTSRRSVYVGLFVFFAGLFLAGTIFTVGTIQNAFSAKLTATAVFEEVGGLQSGHHVWASGMRVGVVRQLAFVDAGQVEVQLRIDTAMAPFIPVDAKATVGSDGLIGNPIIALSGGTRGGPSLHDGAVLQVGKAVSTTELMETLQVNNENLVSITDDIKAITARIRAGEGNLGRLLAEDDLYATVEAALADVQIASANASKLTASLARFSAALNKPGQLPYDLAHDEELLPGVRDTVARLEATAARAEEIASGLADNLSDPNTPVGTLLGDQESGASLQATLANLEQTTILLNEDLIAIRSNFLFRPYFRKQERKAKREARKAAREE